MGQCVLCEEYRREICLRFSIKTNIKKTKIASKYKSKKKDVFYLINRVCILEKTLEKESKRQQIRAARQRTYCVTFSLCVCVIHHHGS